MFYSMLTEDFWIKQVAYFVTLCVCLSIFRKEISNKKKHINDNNENNNNIYQIWLNRWSLLTFIDIILFLLLDIAMNASPYICISVGYIQVPLYNLMQIFFTYYQICRLQYCFDSKQVHSKKYGYPKQLFVFLYAIGIISQILFIIHYCFINSIEATNRGCSIIRHPKYDTLFLFVGGAVNFIWVLLILSLYISKTRQIKRKKMQSATGTFHENSPSPSDVNVISNTNSTESNVTNVTMTSNPSESGGSSTPTVNEIIFRRINYIIFKLLILTVLYLIALFFVAICWEFTNSMNLSWSIFILQLHPISVCIVMYLMIEHNNPSYIKLLKVLRKCGICCCFKSLILASIAEHDESVQDNIVEDNQDGNEMHVLQHDDTTIDTKTHVDLPIHIARAVLSENEDTVTIAI